MRYDYSMFKDILDSLREAMGNFDVSDTPREPVNKTPKKPPMLPAKALRGYQPPTKLRPLPGLPSVKKPPRIPGKIESYDIKTKIANKMSTMDSGKKDIVKNIKAKAADSRTTTVATPTKESSCFGNVMAEWQILERDIKSGMPKTDRQDAMAKRVGVNVHMPNDLTTARSKMRGAMGSDSLATKARDANMLQAKKNKGVAPVGGGSHPVGAAAMPFHRDRLKLRKKYGGKLF